MISSNSDYKILGKIVAIIFLVLDINSSVDIILETKIQIDVIETN
jgi:hypothetical protein